MPTHQSVPLMMSVLGMAQEIRLKDLSVATDMRVVGVLSVGTVGCTTLCSLCGEELMQRAVAIVYVLSLAAAAAVREVRCSRAI